MPRELACLPRTRRAKQALDVLLQKGQEALISRFHIAGAIGGKTDLAELAIAVHEKRSGQVLPLSPPGS
ncbi:MAG: hypothetical protein EOO60_10665 [Hymenobacter sp.]|nr:MAG: hypothetical protein EOO60_10665 [Hymenobacter sp.]